ncbi:bifunctional sugar-1-phosphate nucleotidylyltransferase/acetyltransferase [Methanocrinis sp.]|uniref:bifunctional sugar-1-phosphate nucleotidylyltransferase/acetyltransferase n=1 Tax=Methanocrinis sp. TaxID=3101522 RepID=UPI003D0CB983
MQAIVLAAGEGSRMRPLTLTRPKVMVPVGGGPFLEHLVDRSIQSGVEEFVFVVGYRSSAVRDHFGDGDRFGVEIDYVVQEEQLGTGHALMAAEDRAQERFLVLNGDVLTDTLSLKRVLGAGGPAVAAKEVEDPSRYGVLETEDGLLRSVVEKSPRPPSNLANAGIYLFDRTIFGALRGAPASVRGEFELTDGINGLLSRGEEVRVVEIEDWIELGRPWDVLEANRTLISQSDRGIQGDVEPGATLSGPVSVGEGSTIRSGSYIVGPVLIGRGCDIGPNCFIRPHTCIGDGVRVGNAVEIKNSAIMAGTNVAHLSYVGDSVIGSNCNFGAGTIVANLRHDDAKIRSYIRGESTDSGRRKLGAIIGDDVKTGINTSIYPGTVIAPGYRGRPGEVLRGHVEQIRP